VPYCSVAATVLGSPDPQRLARFYEQLLDWQRVDDQPHWIRLTPPNGGTGLSFQLEDDYVAPQWPPVSGAQHMMMHLDIRTDDLAEAVAFAEQLGARQADTQPQSEVRVMLDPDGHPFCLFLR
jgi:catechol 2,3-dioxygenase-like lactoylglutathione lyase family enzyme